MLFRTLTLVCFLDDFRRQRDDLHELALTKLARHGSEDARANRLACVVDEDGCVVVELDVRTVAATGLFHSPHDDRSHHGTLLDGTVRRGFLDGGRDHVADAGVLTGSRSAPQDRKSTRLNSSHSQISYAVFC